MIERFYAKSLLSFPHIELEFAKGLVVLSGPSGAGKSVLMGSILAGLGLSDGLAQMGELEISLPEPIESDIYDIDDLAVVKLIKKSSLRYYINGQSIPKKELRDIFAPFVHYLSVRDKGGFESEYLLGLIDKGIAAKDAKYTEQLNLYREHFAKYKSAIERLEAIRQSEKELADKIEFARYEIDKIAQINPQEGELEELMATKRQLSRIEKINEAIGKVEPLFGAESGVEELYNLLEKDSGYFSDAMNQLRADIDDGNRLLEELGEMDVESILDRLEQVNSLVKRYGSISEAIQYRKQKEEELAGYEHIEQDKSELEDTITREEAWLRSAAKSLTRERERYAKELSSKIDIQLSKLKLPSVSFIFDIVPLGANGIDRIDMELSGSNTATLSGGEHNRLRLALMSSILSGGSDSHGVVILDEIDANVSGDESIAIAQMIYDLSRNYQVFAISHQPHLAARADQHILVTKTEEKSTAQVLDRDGRVNEISRIVAGEGADEKVMEFVEGLVSGSEQ